MAGNRSPSSSAYYLHLHHSLASTEDLWGTRGWEIPVNLRDSMDERFDLARTQVSTVLAVTVTQNCLYLVEYCLSVWQGRGETTAVLNCGP